MKPKILMLTTNVDAGAGKAALRHHLALLQCGYSSELWYLEGLTDAPRTTRITSIWLSCTRWFKRKFAKFVTRFFSESEKGYKSLSVISSFLSSKINKSDAQIVQLNWVCDFLSITEIGKISKPLVWCFYDMWPLLGTLHYTYLYQQFYWTTEAKPDKFMNRAGTNPRRLERYLWNLKARCWKRRIVVCTPSNWLADHVKASRLSNNWKVYVCGTCVDSCTYFPHPQKMSKTNLGISSNSALIVFGSRNARDSRKGFDLFVEAIGHLEEVDALFAGFGIGIPSSVKNRNIINLGQLSTDLQVATVLSAADLIVLPSRQDNLPQLGIEALSCGCPVVGFDIGGMSDLVISGITGYLSKPFDTVDLAKKITLSLKNLRSVEARKKCRSFALSRFSNSAVIARYEPIYSEVAGN